MDKLEKVSQEDFLKDLEKDPEADVFEKPIVVEEKVEEPKEDEEEARNRHERRMQEKIRKERETNIALAARLEAISEAQKASKTDDAEFLKGMEVIFGNDTPEHTEASRIMRDKMEAMYRTAEKNAEERYNKRLQEERDALDKEEEVLDDMLDNLENEHGADFSNRATKTAFLTLLEKISPKDKDGEIIEYADPESTWELYQKTRDQNSNRAKQLASRGMTASGASQGSTLQPDAMEKYLKDNGLL